jgi:NAD(P)-dependent dehydrogenase (short-subunit alcohol dehydrogenase family)
MAQPVILVTGSTDGIGKATAAELLSQGAAVIIHGKREKEVQVARRELARRSGGEMPDTLIADFSDMHQIRQMAADLISRYSSLHVLINNAGTFQKSRRLTEQGIELTFAVNYLAPFLLTGLLLPLLRKGRPARIVTVASSAHEDVDRIDWDDLPAWHHYRAWDAYALSKFADITFTYMLARKIAGTGVTANCLHPGVTNTRILKASFPGLSGIPPEEGAQTSVYLALSPRVSAMSGRYFDEKKPVPSSKLTRNRSVQERLWKLAEDLTRDPAMPEREVGEYGL